MAAERCLGSPYLVLNTALSQVGPRREKPMPTETCWQRLVFNYSISFIYTQFFTISVSHWYSSLCKWQLYMIYCHVYAARFAFTSSCMNYSRNACEKIWGEELKDLVEEGEVCTSYQLLTCLSPPPPLFPSLSLFLSLTLSPSIYLSLLSLWYQEYTLGDIEQ